MEPQTKTEKAQKEQANRLYRRAHDGDARAVADLTALFAPIYTKMASVRVFKKNLGTVEQGDYEQAAYEALLHLIARSGIEDFFSFGIASAGWAMDRLSSAAIRPTGYSTTVERVNRIRYKLAEELGREPTLEEIIEKSATDKDGKGKLSPGTAVAGLEASTIPRHLDLYPLLPEEYQDPAVRYEDTYFEDEEPEEDVPLRAALHERVEWLLPQARRVVKAVLRGEDEDTVAERFGIKDVDDALKRAAVRIREIEDEPEKYKDYIARAAIRHKLRDDPSLLSVLPPRQREVIELELEDKLQREIGSALGIATMTAGQFSSRAYTTLRTAIQLQKQPATRKRPGEPKDLVKRCSDCGEVKRVTEFHKRRKTGRGNTNFGYQPACKDCKRERDRKYAAKKVERKAAKRAQVRREKSS